MDEEKKLSILAHLKELRQRLLVSVIVVVCTTIISFPISKCVFNFFKSRAPGIELVYISVTEMLTTYMKLSLYLGIALALPFIMYEILIFVAPALNPKEKRYVYPFIFGGGLLFLCGVLFSYFVLLPPALKFLLSIGGDIARPMISVGSYVSVLCQLLFWTGIVFEIPLVMYFLSRFGVVSPASFSRNRKWAVVLAFILAALITPTVDPINQTIVAVPIILLYETGIWLAKLARLGSKPQIATSEVQVQQ